MEDSFSAFVKRLDSKIKGIPSNEVSQLALRNSWRMNLYIQKEIMELNSSDFLIFTLNSLLILSLASGQDSQIKDRANSVALGCLWKANDMLMVPMFLLDARSKSVLETFLQTIQTSLLSKRKVKMTGIWAKIDMHHNMSILSNYLKDDIELIREGSILNYFDVLPRKDFYLLSSFYETLKTVDSKMEFYEPFIERRILGQKHSKEDFRLFEALLTLSNELLGQGGDAVFTFIQKHYYGELTEKVNLSRVIFIGPGGSGKTSLIKALNGEDIVVGEEKPTPGINTSIWKWGSDCEVDIRFWDFAGQVITHAMHKFFLRERCLYVLLLTTRDDQELETQAEYWLEHVRLYGNDAPVIVVANKIDGDSGIVNFDEQKLLNKYPSIISFKKISASEAKSNKKIDGTTYRKLFEEFRTLFIESIQNVVSKYKNELSVEENRIKEGILRINNQEFISQDQFDVLCKDKIEEERIESFKEFLNNLGVIVHFPEFNDDALLNPRWLSYGVYEVLQLAAKAKKKGWISEDEIIRHLKHGKKLDDGTELRFTTEKIKTLIIECIVKFKLGYKIKCDGIEYLVMPSVLDKNQPNHEFSKDESDLHFTFDFEILLPPYVLHAFVSKSSDEIVEDWAWQSGVILRDNTGNVTALVEIFSSRKIDIYIQFKKPFLRKRATNYLDKLIDRFDEIIQGERGAEQPIYKRFIEIPESYFDTDTIFPNESNRMISYKILQNLRERNTEHGDTEYGTFNVQKFFGDYPMKKESTKIQIGTQINMKAERDIRYAERNIIEGDQHNAKGDINIAKNEAIEKLLPLLSEFVETVSVNKEARKEIKEIREFLDELSGHPEEIERHEVEQVKEKFKDKTFLQKVIDLSSLQANFITIADKIVPLLYLLREAIK